MAKKKYVFVIVSAIFAGTSAFAGSLAGNYTLRQPCRINIQGRNFVIPAGDVVISENVPVGDFVNPAHPAIILQSNDDFHPVLTLPIGEYQPFEYGGAPFTIGSYSSDKSEFTEQYFSPSQDLQQTVRLVRSATDLALISFTSPNDQAVVCSMY